MHPFSVGSFLGHCCLRDCSQGALLGVPTSAWGQRFQEDRGYGQVISATEF
jgi:hypothetical protein